MQDFEFWGRLNLCEVCSLFPDRLVEGIGKLEVVRDFRKVFVAACTYTVVADTILWVVGLSYFESFARNEFLE